MAAGDLALAILITALNDASPVIDQVVASLDAVQASVDASSASFATLDASSASLDASLASADASTATLDGSLATLDASATAADASLTTLDASLASVDASLSALDASSAAAGGSLATIDAAAVSADASLATLDASLAGIDAASAAADASLATVDATLATLDASATATGVSLTGLASTDGGVAIAFGDMSAAMAYVDAQLATVDTSAAATGAALTGLAATDGEVAIAFGDLAASLAFVDVSLALYDSSTAAAAASASGASAAVASVGAAADASGASLVGLADANGGVAVAFGNMGAAAAFADSQLALYDASMAGVVVADDAVAASLFNVEAVTAAVGASFEVLIGIAAGIYAVLVGTGIAAAGMAADFQQGVTRLITGAGDVTDNMTKMGQGILQVSADTGLLTSGTDGLNAAMYLVISAGQRGAEALNTLAAAAQGAQIEQARVVDVTQILTTLQTDFGRSTYTATQYMNGLMAAVANGKISLENLSTAMSPILPNAKELGVHFADVAAAMSDMTNQGIPADQAATALRFVMQSMILPTKGSAAAMKEWGLNSTKVAAEMKVSLPGAIQMYIDAAKRAGPEGSKPFIDALSNMMGGGQRAAKALFSLSQSMGTWRADIGLVNTALGLNSKQVMGWDLAQGNLNIKVDQAKAAFAAMLITVGTGVLPILTRLVTMIQPLIIAFTQWVVQSHIVENSVNLLVSAIGTLIAIGSGIVAFFQRSELALSALKGVAAGVAVAIGVALVVAFYSLAVAAWTAAAGVIAATWPFILIGAAVALVVAAFIHFYNTSAGFRSVIDQIVGALKQAWAALVQFGSYLIAQVGPGIAMARQFFIQLWATLQQGWAIVVQVAAALARIGVAIYSTVLPFINSLVGIIKGQFIPVWQTLQASFAQLYPLVGQLGAVFRMLWATAQQLAAIFMSELMPTLRSTWQEMQKMWSIVGPQLLPTLKLLGMIIGGILLISLGLLVGVLTGVTAALAMFLRGVIAVITGVVQVITGFVQVITGILSLIVDIFTGKWNKIGADTAMIWQGIQNIIRGILNIIVGIVTGTFGVILAFIDGFVQGVIGFFTALAHALVGGSIVPDMCNAILRTFTGMISSVLAAVIGFISNLISQFISLNAQAIALVIAMASALIAQFRTMVSQGMAQAHALVSGIIGIFSQLPAIAMNAGLAVANGIANGIRNGIGAAIGAAQSLAAAVANFLPHSPAKVGPLSDLDKSMPAMIAMLTKGMEAGIPAITASMRHVVQPIAAPLAATGSTFAGGRFPVNGGTGTQVIQITVQSPDIYLDGADVTQKIGKRLAQEIRRQAAVRNV